MNKFTLLILFLFTSCDCHLEQYGVVVDSETRQPIKDAKVSLSQWVETTNDSGEFEFSIVTGFCPEREILIQKEGYRDLKLEIKQKGGQYVYLVATNYGYHEYSEPIPSTFNPKIKEQGSYFDLYSTRFEVIHPDSIIFILEKKKSGT